MLPAGKTVDEPALIDALKQKKTFAAGIDTFTQEPVEKDNPLLSLTNVVTLPHIGSATLDKTPNGNDRCREFSCRVTRKNTA